MNQALKTPKPLKTRIAARIARTKSDVFVPGDFTDLGGYDQVLRALRKLVADGTVGKMGYGVYLRLEESIIPGVSERVPTTDFDGAVRQALKKLRVAFGETQTVRDYNAGRTTQVQSNSVLVLKEKRRFKRKLAYDGMEPVLRSRQEDLKPQRAAAKWAKSRQMRAQTAESQG